MWSILPIGLTKKVPFKTSFCWRLKVLLFVEQQSYSWKIVVTHMQCSLQKEDSVHWIMKGSNINFFDFSSSSSATQMKSGPAIIPSHEILMSRFPVFLVSLLV